MNEYPSLIDDIQGDRAIVELLQDRSCAVELYCALSNVRWRKPEIRNEDEIVRVLKTGSFSYFSISWRHAGRVVAEIRNKHYGTDEDYMDYYAGGNEGTVSPTVRSYLNRLGWVEYLYP